MQPITPYFLLTQPQRSKQRGASLLVIIIFVMLCMLLALWSSRTSLFNEMIVGNDADYQRAFEAAQTILQDAELDIRGENADGSTCIKVSGQGSICRDSSTLQIPLEDQEIPTLMATLTNLDPDAPCLEGICGKFTGEQDFWNNPAILEKMMQPNVGARYGEYTGALLSNDQKPSNPILADRSSTKKGGWYWIEVLNYDNSAANSTLITNNDSTQIPLNLKPNVVFRVTAIAFGLKPNTQAVLQQTYAKQRLNE